MQWGGVCCMRYFLSFGGTMMEQRYSRLFAPLCALALLLTACSGGSDAGGNSDDGYYDDGSYEQPSEPSKPGSGGTGDDVSDNPTDPKDPPDEPTDPTEPTEPTGPSYKNVSEILKGILGAEYETISGNISQNITLTAQTVKAVSDIFPVLESVITNANEMDSAKEQVVNADNDTKKALVAQSENKISIKGKEAEYEGYYSEDRSTVRIYEGYGYEIAANGDMNIIVSGKFNYFYERIESLEGNVDISELEIYSGKLKGWDDDLSIPMTDLKEKIYDKFNLSNKSIDALPKLSLGLVNDDYDYGLKHFLVIYKKYNKNEKMQLTGTFGEIDGRYLVDGVTPDNYTMFESDGNTVKSDNSVKSVDINELIDFANQYDINTIKNIKINGTLSSAKTVDWMLTNVVFETSMANLTNSSSSDLNGVVYFKDLPYASTNKQSIDGVVRYDKLAASINKISSGTEASVVDMRGIDKNTMNSYSISNIFRGSVSSVYFADGIKELSRNGSGENPEFYKKFIDITSANIYNEYYGTGDREDSCKLPGSADIPASKKARTLKEFEYYGNNFKFEKSAYDSYDGNFEGLLEWVKNSLQTDKTTKWIASAMYQTSVFFV